MKKLIVLTALTSAAFAAYGPAPKAAVHASNWTLGVGYGQMFGMQETTLPSGGERNAPFDAKIDKPTIFEVDLFNCNGFGAVYMTTAKKKGIISSSSGATGEYNFNAYLLGYQKAFSQDMTWRLGLGLSDQKFVSDAGATSESGSKFAYSASAAYHTDLSGDMKGFIEAGYLGQAKFVFTGTDEISGSGFYVKFGAKVTL